MRKALFSIATAAAVVLMPLAVQAATQAEQSLVSALKNCSKQSRGGWNHFWNGTFKAGGSSGQLVIGYGPRGWTIGWNDRGRDGSPIDMNSIRKNGQSYSLSLVRFNGKLIVKIRGNQLSGSWPARDWKFSARC